ncbi:hypothetical protein GCM10022398_28840 [Acetobacter lovaniensis]|nr:hypothetical protein AA0474_2197 [Acetobacter lovaniensis NRIC 0474]
MSTKDTMRARSGGPVSTSFTDTDMKTGAGEEKTCHLSPPPHSQVMNLLSGSLIADLRLSLSRQIQ